MTPAVTPGCPVCPGPHDPPPPLPPGPPRVSVVVAHYEQHADLARTLRCLELQSLPPHEVVVSDDGSARAPDVPAGVRLLTQPDRGFRAALARNRGVAATTGDLVVMLDADTHPEPDLLREITAPLLTAPDLLVVGRRRHTAHGALDDADPDDPLARVEERATPDPAWLARGWADSDDLRAGDASSFRFVISAVLACRRWWWDRVGGFDATFDAYGGEDWELAHRWWDGGGRLRHAPRAVAWHHGPDAGGEPRTADPTPETTAVAAHVPTAPVGFRGLRVAPAALVVGHDEELDDRELLIAVDGLLAALPHAAVLTDRPALLALGDPRVGAADGSDVARTAVHGLDLHRGLVGDPEAWAAWAAVPRDALRTTVLGQHGAPVATWTDLRLLRRAHLGLEPAGEATEPLAGLEETAPGTSLAAWLGGWW